MSSKVSCPLVQLMNPNKKKKKSEWLMVIKRHDFLFIKMLSWHQTFSWISRTSCQIETRSWYDPGTLASSTALFVVCRLLNVYWEITQQCLCLCTCTINGFFSFKRLVDHRSCICETMIFISTLTTSPPKRRERNRKVWKHGGEKDQG